MMPATCLVGVVEEQLEGQLQAGEVVREDKVEAEHLAQRHAELLKHLYIYMQHIYIYI